MWKPPSSILGRCLAALPLIGCVDGFSSAPTAVGVASATERVYATDTATPAAILVFVPATDAIGGGDLLTGDPAFWGGAGVRRRDADHPTSRRSGGRAGAAPRFCACAGGRADLAGRPGLSNRGRDAPGPTRPSFRRPCHLGNFDGGQLQPDRLLLEPRWRSRTQGDGQDLRRRLRHTPADRRAPRSLGRAPGAACSTSSAADPRDVDPRPHIA